MPYDENNEYDEDASFYKENSNHSQIDPRDSYSDRFAVSPRQTINRSPKPAITSTNKISNKDKLFTSKHSSSRYGGGVDMASVAKAAEQISKKKEAEAARIAAANSASRATAAQSVQNYQSEQGAQSSQYSTEQDKNYSTENDGVVEKLRSSGLDSLFSSTSAEVDKIKTSVKNVQKKVVDNVSQNHTAQSEQHEATDAGSASADTTAKIPAVYSNNNQAKTAEIREQINPAKAATEQFRKLRQERKLQVIKPLSMNTAKEISSALAAGDAVVLVLTHCYSDLSKRILDFAFGAASMCGAKVKVEGNQVYAFTVGEGLTQRERLLCVKQGIMLRNEADDDGNR